MCTLVTEAPVSDFPFHRTQHHHQHQHHHQLAHSGLVTRLLAPPDCSPTLPKCHPRPLPLSSAPAAAPSMSNPSESSKVYADAADSYYDPDFTVDISKKMQVPSQIKLAPSANGSDVMQDPTLNTFRNDSSRMMRVPERICVVGGESHRTTREPPLEQKLEQSFLGKPTSDYELHVQLATPPSTLRIEDTAPVFDTPVRKLDRALKTMESGRSTMKSADNRLNDSMIDYEDPELNTQSYLQLRRRLVQIQQRLDALEIENRQRRKRDYILYTSLCLYLLFRGIRFVASQNQF